MPTPVAHSLAAVAICGAGGRLSVRWNWSLPLLVVIANIPDIDFLPGIFVGNPTAYHWGPTHSLLAAVLFGILAGCVVGRITGEYLKGIVLATAAYGSHIVLDLMIGGHSHIPVGLNLFWPLSNTPVRLEWDLFSMAPVSITTAGPFATLLSPAILPMIQRELLVMLPVLGAFWGFTRLPKRRDSQ